METYLNNKSIINVLPNDNSSDMKYLVGVLNSKVISFFHSRRAVKSNRLVFPKAVLADVNRYPIVVPDADAGKVVSDNVEILLRKNQELDTLRTNFTTLLRADFSSPKVSPILEAWHETTFTELLSEFVKQKVAIDLNKKAEWIKYHATKVEEYGNIRRAIEAAEAAIDEKVCDIYGLSPEEAIIINGAPLMERPRNDDH